jgi:HEAT repeat protein
VYGTDRQQRPGRRLPLWALLAGLLLGASAGCNGPVWDEITSREYHFKDVFKPKPLPLEVLKESPDGDARARAFRALGERDWDAAEPQEREAILAILTTAVVNEHQSVARLEAIKVLARFNDPRAARALTDAYYKATRFPLETAQVLMCQSLTGLGQTGHPDAIELLASVVREPPIDPRDVTQAQRQNDRKIAAARALGHFDEYQATEALLDVLRTAPPSYVALRNRANDSLQHITHQDFPPDAMVWADYLHASPEKREQYANSGGFGKKLLEILQASWRPQ